MFTLRMGSVAARRVVAGPDVQASHRVRGWGVFFAAASCRRSVAIVDGADERRTPVELQVRRTSQERCVGASTDARASWKPDRPDPVTGRVAWNARWCNAAENRHPC